jgi:hypothetical protein
MRDLLALEGVDLLAELRQLPQRGARCRGACGLDRKLG